MTKISVSKNEEAAEVVERVLGEEASEVVLVIPKGAELGKAAANFYLLKRETDSAGKRVLVESVDENVLALAKAAGIGASHPLFEGVQIGPSFSDIKPKRAEPVAEEKIRGRKRKKLVVEEAASKEKPEAESVTLRVQSAEPAELSPQQFLADEAITEEEADLGIGAPKRRLSRKIVVRAAVAVVLLGFLVWFFGGVFSRAAVEIDFAEEPWTHEGKFTADASVSKADPSRKLLPAELFSLDRNLTQLFAASGMSEVSEKAKGKIWIYNAFNSSPQTLVATTRFETPEGKVFRIAGQVKVPGAVVKDGQIIPSSIEADVVADKAGPEYNVGPTPRLTIPGFKNSPRYNGFYGELKEPTKGGFIGKKAVPTADDIQKARERATEILKTSLEANFASSYPQGFLILDGASKLDIKKLTVDASTDEKGNFSVFGEATMRALGFREEDLRLSLLSLLLKEKTGTDFKELKLDYAGIQADFDKKKLSFTLSAEGFVWPDFSADDFKAQILGKKVGEVRSMVAGLKGLSRGKVSVWPIWLGSIPKKPSRVEIKVD